MERVKVQNRKKWNETNKEHKKQRMKWKEQNLIKKIKKQKMREQTQDDSKSELKVAEKPTKRISTISIAVPGSILENAQSFELRTYLAGQIARAASIFQIDEIIVFDDSAHTENVKNLQVEDSNGLKTVRHCCVQFGRILQFLECPQYLRKHFFPIHKDLKYAGVLNPLDAPHHLRQHDNFAYREGVVTTKPVKMGKGSLVDVGLPQNAAVDKLLTPGLRCTVKLLQQQEGSKKLKGVVVSPSVPRQETGVYWGYTVRVATCLSQVFAQCPYKRGYDICIGTSDKGTSVDSFDCPTFKHLLIVFGGLQGLEAALDNDDILQADNPSLLFDYYINTLPYQGSRTIRTEEAVLISLAALRPKLNPKCRPISCTATDHSIALNTFTESNNKMETSMNRFD